MEHQKLHGDAFFCASDCPACFWERSAKKPFMTTFTGKRIHPFALKPEDVCIEDVAHHLACINRWVGCLREPISVAQHSIYVSMLCWSYYRGLEGLLHDRAEAYLGDVSKWVKMSPPMDNYRVLEADVERVTAEAFGIQNGMPPEVEHADRLMINIEAGWSWGDRWEPLPGFPVPTTPWEKKVQARFNQEGSWPWKLAETLFLDFYEQLKEGSYAISIR